MRVKLRGFKGACAMRTAYFPFASSASNSVCAQ